MPANGGVATASRSHLRIAFDPQGRLWAADFANRRYSIFGSDLELEESWPYLDAFRASFRGGPIDREGALHNHTTLWSDAGLQPAYSQIPRRTLCRR